MYVFGKGGVDALAFRRGWKHGILAMAVLPVILAGVMLAFDRYVRRRLRPEKPPALWKPLWILSAITVLSHPWLDFLNTYGVRFLAPFSWKWFYGDALFIIDPWVWITLIVGVPLASFRRRRDSPNPNRPAQVALILVGMYAAGMILSGVAGRFAANWRIPGSERRMVGPVWMKPWRRQLVLDFGKEYRYGSVEFHPWPSPELSNKIDPNNSAHTPPREAAAGATRQKFLVWSRFPVYRIARQPDGSARVELGDARYPPNVHGDWPATVIVLPAKTATFSGRTTF